MAPKSGEQEIQTAPEETASIIITVSEQLGTKPATIVFFFTPKSVILFELRILFCLIL